LNQFVVSSQVGVIDRVGSSWSKILPTDWKTIGVEAFASEVLDLSSAYSISDESSVSTGRLAAPLIVTSKVKAGDVDAAKVGAA
jgi:hypothetical protein